MTAQKLLERAWRAYRGKDITKTPVWASDKANMVLDIANQKKDEWAKDPNQVWSSLFDIKDITPVIDVSTFTYSLDASFLFPSDYFLILRTTGDIAQVSLTKPQKRLDNETSLYISGSNPKKVTFAGTFIDAGFSGGTLKAPGYYLPADMTTSTSVVAVDDPDWLVYATAAELARNDPAKEDQFSNLLGMANNLYEKMIAANNNIGFKQDNSIPYDMPSIGDSSQDEAFL